MRESFSVALSEVLKHEGGYVNHPRDPGGATNRGVTQRVYNTYRMAKGKKTQTVKAITWDEIGEIYRTRYWDAVRGDNLPLGVDLALFDFAVNSGPFRAAQFIQRLVGVKPDGSIGPITLEAIKMAEVGLVDKLCDARMKFLRALPHWRTFGRGWTRRVDEVRAVAKTMRKEAADAGHV